jgi:hypothetical protein
MSQIDREQRFCVHCGTAITSDIQHCGHCGTVIEARHRQSEREEAIADAEATQRVVRSALAASPVQEEVQNGSDTQDSLPLVEDPDATVRVPARFSSRQYAQAITQESLGTSATSLQAKRRSAPGKWARRYRTRLRVACGVGLTLLLALLVAGVTGAARNPHQASQVLQSKAQLDRLISQARAIGTPVSLLQPVLKQERQLDSSSQILPVANLFDTRADQNLVAGYRALRTRLSSIIIQATAQAQRRAQQDLQDFQTALTQKMTPGVGPIDSFSQQLSQDQLALATARTLRDYAAVSRSARQSMLALEAMGSLSSQLTDFNATIMRLKSLHIDVTAMQTEYQNDVQVFNDATRLQDFQNLSALIDAQYQQAIIGSVQAFPYVSLTQLNEMERQVRLLKTYGVDAGVYQQRLNADQVAAEQAKSIFDDLLCLKQIEADMASIHKIVVPSEARYLVRQYQQEVNTWAKRHPYYDRYDGHTYALDSGYMQQGIGADISKDLASAVTTADFAAMVDEVQNALFNLHMLEADYNDHTPYDQVHQTDLNMLTHYQLEKRMVLMVSLVEQVMRVYQEGKQVHAFLVTTGRAERPSLPGVWAVLDRKSPMIFQSGDPRGSPYWFPDTPIIYAILYHYGGFYVHDAWWRTSFGPGTQFPHQDAGGNTAYNFDGSHGCINLSRNDAAWVYQHTDWNTLIVVY